MFYYTPETTRYHDGMTECESDVIPRTDAQQTDNVVFGTILEHYKDSLITTTMGILLNVIVLTFITTS